MSCGCREKANKPKFGVATPSHLKFGKGQITGCNGVATAPTGQLVYGFQDLSSAQAFVKYLASTYQINAKVLR